jgi:hypothetical protein
VRDVAALALLFVLPTAVRDEHHARRLLKKVLGLKLTPGGASALADSVLVHLQPLVAGAAPSTA